MPSRRHLKTPFQNFDIKKSGNSWRYVQHAGNLLNLKEAQEINLLILSPNFKYVQVPSHKIDITFGLKLSALNIKTDFNRKHGMTWDYQEGLCLEKKPRAVRVGWIENRVKGQQEEKPKVNKDDSRRVWMLEQFLKFCLNKLQCLNSSPILLCIGFSVHHIKTNIYLIPPNKMLFKDKTKTVLVKQ